MLLLTRLRIFDYTKIYQFNAVVKCFFSQKLSFLKRNIWNNKPLDTDISDAGHELPQPTFKNRVVIREQRNRTR